MKSASAVPVVAHFSGYINLKTASMAKPFKSDAYRRVHPVLEYLKHGWCYCVRHGK